MAGAHEFISQLKDGYDTYIGERGVKLSGGQKQRISIARVFLKNPAILILDEATSALDNESEHLVNQSLERLAQGRTTMTIAHRLSTIQGADRILVLAGNRIVDEGNHARLLEHPPQGLLRVFHVEGVRDLHGAAHGLQDFRDVHGLRVPPHGGQPGARMGLEARHGRGGVV